MLGVKSQAPKRSHFFKACGQKGGKARARHLSAARRSAIAARAAHVRWKKPVEGTSLMPSIRIENPALDNPAYVEEILCEGSLEDWKAIYHCIIDRPFGPEAQALEQAIASTSAYGVIPLWRGLLQTVRGANV